jgi:hypothetical protein
MSDNDEMTDAELSQLADVEAAAAAVDGASRLLTPPSSKKAIGEPPGAPTAKRSRTGQSLFTPRTMHPWWPVSLSLQELRCAITRA